MGQIERLAESYAVGWDRPNLGFSGVGARQHGYPGAVHRTVSNVRTDRYGGVA
jgi:hypothetical protein